MVEPALAKDRDGGQVKRCRSVEGRLGTRFRPSRSRRRGAWMVDCRRLRCGRRREWRARSNHHSEHARRRASEQCKPPAGRAYGLVFRRIPGCPSRASPGGSSGLCLHTTWLSLRSQVL